MTYRTKRPRTRALLTFGAGATLAIAQLGAGCVPPGDTVYADEDAEGDAREGEGGPARTAADASAGDAARAEDSAAADADDGADADADDGP